MISKDELKRLCLLSKIEITSDETDLFLTQIEKSIEYINSLDNLELDYGDFDSLQMSYYDLREDIEKKHNVPILSGVLTKDGFLKGPKMN